MKLIDKLKQARRMYRERNGQSVSEYESGMRSLIAPLKANQAAYEQNQMKSKLKNRVRDRVFK